MAHCQYNLRFGIGIFDSERQRLKRDELSNMQSSVSTLSFPIDHGTLCFDDDDRRAGFQLVRGSILVVCDWSVAGNLLRHHARLPSSTTPTSSIAILPKPVWQPVFLGPSLYNARRIPVEGLW